MFRKIIQINEDKCNGCGDCVPNCAEGALQIIDGKARLISDLFCDGLGACLGHCPTGAISVIEREAEPYDERKVMEYIIKGGKNVIYAHLKHLKEHNEVSFLKEAEDFLVERGIPNPLIFEEFESHSKSICGCPGSESRTIEAVNSVEEDAGHRSSQLRQWPIQLHLVSPNANYFQNSDLLLAADCCSFAYGDFHKDFMKGKSVAIACPKLDSNKQVYFDKIITMINESNLKSIHVIIMQVPCCSGLLQLAQQAIEMAERAIPLRAVVVGINGELLKDIWIN
jgi:NAD-dependent dihydropyrimidine dehydrogenase PreA subunit